MAGPWEKYQGAAGTPPASGRIFTLPPAPKDADPDAPLNHKIKMIQAAKAALNLKIAQDAYDSAHPKGTTATVLGPASLKGLSTPDQELVKALADGRLAFPGGFALKAPWWQQKLEQVAAYDPSFDATNFNNRAKARAILLSGKVGASANALNTAIGHLGLLQTQIGGTASHKFTPANAIINKFEQITGDPGITNFKDTAGKLAAELTSVYRNGGGAEADVVRQLQSLDPNASEEQKSSLIRNALDLLASKQAANIHQYNIGSGGKPEVDLLDPAAREVLNQFPDIRDKYFSQPAAPLSSEAAALLRSHGGTPPPPTGTNTPPPPPPPPPTPTTPATGATKTEVYQTDADKKVAAMLAGGVPAAKIKSFVANSGQDYGGKLDSVLAWRALNPAYKGGYNVHSQDIVPTTLANRAAANPLSALPYAIANAGTAGTLDEIKGAVNTVKDGGSLADNIAAANLEKQTIADMNHGLDLTGNVIGGAGAMIGGGLGLKALLSAGAKGGVGRNLVALALNNPIKTAMLGDAGYGAAYGAGENNDNRALGAGVGGVTGLVTSPVGAGLSKAVGSTLTGVVNPAVQRLRAAGIPLTVGEVLGGGAKKAQDALTSVFGPGSMVMRRYDDGRRALNQAFFDEAGNVVGTPIDKVGQAGVQALDAAKSQAYSSALDPVSLNLDTPSFIEPMKGVLAGAKEIPAGDLPQGYAANTIGRFVGNNLMPDGTMSGSDFQKAYRGLARTANAASGKVEGYDIGQALGQAKDILSGALADQNPQAYQGFLAANRANRMLNIIASAQKAAKNQISDGGEVLATPAQFGAAATNNAAKYGGNIAAASGSRPFNQLINDSQQVMSSRLPTSGTVERALVTGLATGGAASLPGIGYEADGDTGAAVGAGLPLALTLLGTKKGQQMLTAALIKRTVADQAAGRMATRNPQIGGALLSSLGIPLLDSPSAMGPQ